MKYLGWCTNMGKHVGPTIYVTHLSLAIIFHCLDPPSHGTPPWDSRFQPLKIDHVFSIRGISSDFTSIRSDNQGFKLLDNQLSFFILFFNILRARSLEVWKVILHLILNEMNQSHAALHLILGLEPLTFEGCKRKMRRWVE